eukprot:6181402-Pleurochrysis_carterae.AAC.2
MLGRLVKECGMSFEAAATAKALVITMHTRKPPTADMRIDSTPVGDFFRRLGALDVSKRREHKNLAAGDSIDWSIGADAGS